MMKTIKENNDFVFSSKEKETSRVRMVVLCILLVIAAVMLIWPYVAGHETMESDEKEPGQMPVATPAPTLAPESLSARQVREAAYEKDMAKLQALLQDETIKEETRQQASLQMTKMVEQHQMELGVEEALTNAGFAPCLVLMQNDALTVAVNASEVTAAQSAVILSICLAHTEVSAENIRIMPGGV